MARDCFPILGTVQHTGEASEVSSIAVRKYITKLKARKVCMNHSSRTKTPVVGKAWWQECETNGHVTSSIKKQRIGRGELLVLSLLSLSLEPQTTEQCYLNLE